MVLLLTRNRILSSFLSCGTNVTRPRPINFWIDNNSRSHVLIGNSAKVLTLPGARSRSLPTKHCPTFSIIDWLSWYHKYKIISLAPRLHPAFQCSASDVGWSLGMRLQIPPPPPQKSHSLTKSAMTESMWLADSDITVKAAAWIVVVFGAYMQDFVCVD